jgi:hypothetical protein
MSHLLRALSVRSIVWFAVLVAIPELLPGTAAAQNTAAALSLSPRLLADASWHGRQIQRPLARRSDIADRKPSLGLGTGFSRPGGSRRVRDLQRRLARLGYRPGTPDGLFGTRTQAAVLAFQRKHGLRRTGSVGSGVLRVLRHRTTPGATPAPLVQTQGRRCSLRSCSSRSPSCCSWSLVWSSEGECSRHWRARAAVRRGSSSRPRPRRSTRCRHLPLSSTSSHPRRSPHAS